MNTRKSVRYVCRFCAAGGATEVSDAPLFHSCHVCKAPDAMIPVGMHDQLIKLLATVETLYAQRDQAIRGVEQSYDLLNKGRVIASKIALRHAKEALTNQAHLAEGWKGMQKPGESEDAVNPVAGEVVHFRTWLNRLIDRCPEAVQQHIWDLREQAEPEEERYSREDLEDAYRAGFDFAQVRFKARMIDSFKTTPGWRRHNLQTGLGNFLRKLRGNTEADNTWGSDDD